MELIRPGTQIDFMGQTRVFGALSVVVVAVFLGVMVVRGFNFGVEFTGGTVIQIHVPESAGPVDEGRLRGGLGDAGFAGASIVRIGSAADREFRIMLGQSEEEAERLSFRVLDTLSEQLGAEVELRSTESIGPRVGREMRRAGFGSVALACFLILIYVWFRFDLRYAPGAVAALVHDVIFTAGIFAALQLEFNLQVLAALLVVIGYSLNDTIVIYDRIRENLELRGSTRLPEVINQSINQTLSRTLLTSITTMTVVLALLVLGGPVIRGFAIALAIGVAIGTYSTVYVASGLLVVLQRFWGGSQPRAA